MSWGKQIENVEALHLAKKKCLELLLEFDTLCKANQITYWLDGGTLLGAVRHGGFIPWDDDVDVCVPYDDYLKVLNLLEQYCNRKEGRLLYFYNTDFEYVCDYFGNIAYLVDGIMPVKIDIIPVKFVKNTQESITFDRSLNEVLHTFVRGNPKFPAQVLPAHHAFLVGKNNSFEKRTMFFGHYEAYLSRGVLLKKDTESLITYSCHDLFVSKTRDYYTHTSIFPLKSVNFEGVPFPAPNDTDSYLKILYGNHYMQPPPLVNQITHLRTFYTNDSLDVSHIKQLIRNIYRIEYKYSYIGFKNKKWRKVFKVLSIASHLLGVLASGNLKLFVCLWRYRAAHLKRR